MTVPLTRRAIACAMLGAWIAAPARAQLAVYDPTNY